MVADGLTVRVARCLLSSASTQRKMQWRLASNRLKDPNLGPKSAATVRAWMGIEQTKPKNTGQFGPGNLRKPKGATNKVTRRVQGNGAKAARDNADNVGAWLVQVAQATANKGRPSEGSGLAGEVGEFAAPKLGRVEHTSKTAARWKPSPALSWWT